MQGKIVKILGRMDCRTVLMEKDSEVPRRRVLVALLSTEDSNDSQKHIMVCVLYLLVTQPLLIRSFHLSDPYFSVSCPKGVR